jgi:outer membrane immunogenic protein
MTKRITSFFALTTFVLAVSGSAFAADIAVKAPPLAPAPAVYNWTGWYAGVNAGASFGNVRTDFNAPFTGTFFVPGVGTGVFNTDFAGSNREYPDGFIGGGQIGYNWQLSPIWVVGLEADFQGALEKDSNTLTSNFTGPISPPGAIPVRTITGSTVLDYQTKIDWFGTVRARIGYVWGNGEVMSYVTAGLAYGEVKINGTNTVSGAVAVITPFSLTDAIGHSQVNTGWVVGYGSEGRLGNSNWTWKVEGLYMDLGTLDATNLTVRDIPLSSLLSVAGGQVTTHSHFTDGILRGGLNYQFH